MSGSRPKNDPTLAWIFLLGLPMIGVGSWICHQIYGLPSVTLGFVVGSSVSLANAVAGTVLLQWGLGRSPNALLAVVLGGFLARLIVVLLVLLGLMHLTSINPYALGLSVAGFYFAFMFVELFGLRERLFPTRKTNEIASSSS